MVRKAPNSDEIKNLLYQGDISKALEMLRDYVQEDKNYNNESMQLLSRFFVLKQREKMALFSDSDFFVEQNKIISAALNILQEIELQGTELDNTDRVEIGLHYMQEDWEMVESIKTVLFQTPYNISIQALEYNKIITRSPVGNIMSNTEDIIIIIYDAEMFRRRADNLFEITRRIRAKQLKVITIIKDYSDVEALSVDLDKHKDRSFSPRFSVDETVILVKTSPTFTEDLQHILIHSIKVTKHHLAKTISHKNQLEAALKNEIKYENIPILLELVKIYEILNDHDKAKEYKNTIAKLRTTYNDANPITIADFHLKNTSIFEDIDWKLQPNINVLLGRNGFGKSHLLRLLPCLLQNEKYIMDIDYRLMVSSSLDIWVEQNKERKQTHYYNCNFMENIGNIPILCIPAVRNLNAASDLAQVGDKLIVGELKTFSAKHFIQNQRFDAVIQNQLFELGLLLVKHQQLVNKSIEDMEDASPQEYFKTHPLVDLIKNAFMDLTGSTFKFAFANHYEGAGKVEVFVNTEGNDEPIALQKVSQGTISIISILTLIYFYLKSLFGDVPDLTQKKAIVIIDEIDAHLHPEWQRKIVHILRNSYPNVQFILSAHSPLVVAGCLEREVSVLRKGESGRFSLAQFENHFIGKGIEDIYREVFNLENPNDDLSFLRYDSKATSLSDEMIETEIDILIHKDNISADEELRLKDLFRMRDVKTVIENRESKDLENQISELKAKNMELEYQLAQFSKEESTSILDYPILSDFEVYISPKPITEAGDGWYFQYHTKNKQIGEIISNIDSRIQRLNDIKQEIEKNK